MEIEDLNSAVIKLTSAQEQTTKNIDELRLDLKLMIKNMSNVAVLKSETNVAHKRIDDCNKKYDGMTKMLITTLISAIFSLLGVVFLFINNGGG